MSRTMIQSLQEMFPNHSISEIERAVVESNGSTENAINRLLSTPATNYGRQSSHRPRNAPISQLSQPSPSSRSNDHIFPDDFLRWPKNVEYVCVSSELVNSPLQTDEDVIGPSNEPGMAPIGEAHAVEKGSFNGANQLSGWSKLKAKFMSMGSGYNQI